MSWAMRSNLSRHNVLVALEQTLGDPQRVELRLDDLAPPVLVLGHEPCPLEDRDVLLHGREAHWVMLGKLGHALVAMDGAADDVSPCPIRECAEDPVEVDCLPDCHLH